ncbi:MAG: N-acetylmuramoyl-L-alanine amidase [Clostridiales bacterium]|nr:N-acetylmuramoyl-L-alanine amidase [Clostridiales bacterium]
MIYTVKKNIANKNNYGGKRSVSSIKYIVVHFTANDGDTDEANGNYFKNNVVKTSAHYFIDDDSVTQSVPDGYIAYAVGGGKYSDCYTTGGGKLYGIATNSNTLNFELCDTKRDGKIMATEKTLDNAAEFISKKMKEYNVDIDHVIRHFDVNGKHCPAYFMVQKEWDKFKDRILEKSIRFKKPSSTWVRNVQKKLGATVDGIPGPETLSKTIKLSKWTNAKHPVVVQVQNRLNSLGYTCGKADGIYGDKTEAAVKKLQKDIGIKEEGWIGKGQTTWKVLLGLKTN